MRIMISVCYVDACCHWLGGRCPHFPNIAYKHCLSCAHIQDTPRNPKLIIGINSGINGWQRWMDGWRLQIAYWKPSPNSLTCTRQHMGSQSVFCVCVCVCVYGAILLKFLVVFVETCHYHTIVPYPPATRRLSPILYLEPRPILFWC